MASQTDDDDDDMSGGALAVLLLAVGGAVAGVLYAAPPGSDLSARTPATIAFEKKGGETVGVTVTGTDSRGRPTRSHSVAGARVGEGWSYNLVNARTVAFTRKAGRASLTGRIVVAPDGRSLVIATDRTDAGGRPVKRQTTYQMRR